MSTLEKPNYNEATDHQLRIIVENPYASKMQHEAAQAEIDKRLEEMRSRYHY